MEMPERKLKAVDVDGGNMIRQLDAEIQRAMEDIADMNKKATKPRVVRLELTFAPSKSRREAEASYLVTLKPSVHVDREKTVVFIDRNDKGEVLSAPRRLDQPMLPSVELEDAADEDAAH